MRGPAGYTLTAGIFLPSASDHFPASGAKWSDDVAGLSVLFVEDSLAVGEAVKQLLELLGASVAGPAATTAAAESLLAQRLPDVALVDFHLRGGERSDVDRAATSTRRTGYFAFGVVRISRTVIIS
jgi:hypothetical protein